MVVKWLREHATASALMVLFRLYLGYEWMMAGWEKSRTALTPPDI